jgi:hypothetical protein
MRVAIASVGFAAPVFQNAGAVATTGTAGDAAIAAPYALSRCDRPYAENVANPRKVWGCQIAQTIALPAGAKMHRRGIGYYPTGQPAPADNRPMTAEQAETLRRLAKDAYELDAFKPNLTRAEADRRIGALTAKLKLLDEPPHTLWGFEGEPGRLDGCIGWPATKLGGDLAGRAAVDPPVMTGRRFPPPWTFEEASDA